MGWNQEGSYVPPLTIHTAVGVLLVNWIKLYECYVQAILRTVMLELSVIALTNAKASGVAERMLSTRPS